MITRRYPLLLIHPWLLVTAALLCCALIALNWLLISYLAIPFDADSVTPLHALKLLLIAIMFVFGCIRAARFHPALDQPYARWLMTTPWAYPQPLPFGPIHLVPQDLLYLAPVFLLEHFYLHQQNPLTLITFLSAYLATSLLAQCSSKISVYTILIAVSATAISLLFNSSWLILVLLLILYIFSTRATVITLRTFPWNIGLTRPEPIPDWPFTRLAPSIQTRSISNLHALLLATFLAWCAFCFATSTDIETLPDALQFTTIYLLILGGVAAGFRLFRYAYLLAPPISLLGRIATGNILLPGYDKIFLAPLLTLLTAFISIAFLYLLPFPLPLLWAIGTLLTFLPALLLGPTLRNWQLTGHHRHLTPRQYTQPQSRTSRPQSPATFSLR